MSSKNEGGSAFPETFTDYDYSQSNEAFFPNTYSCGGMTLRDYFAAKAMAAMISTAGAPCLAGLEKFEPYTAKAAYIIADAMIAARDA
jgi:hypothetical protein